MAANSRQKLEIAKALIARHYPDGSRPEGLLTDLYRALGEAEMRGFDDCMAVFERQYPANDNPAEMPA